MTARAISNAGGNFDATGAWAAGVVPIAGDSITATGTSGQLTINVSTPVLIGADFTGYVSTLTLNANLNCNTTVKFVAGMTVAGTAGSIVSALATSYTSAGKTLTGGLTCTGAVTHTFVDDWTVNGLVTLGASTVTTTLNTSTLTCAGGLSIGGTTSTVTGSTNIKVTGGTIQSAQTSTGALANNLEMAGTHTFSGNVRYKTGTFKHSSGTQTSSSGVLLIQAACTLDLNAASPTIAFTFNATGLTATLASNFNTSGLLTVNGSTTFSGAFTITCGSFAQVAATTGTITIGGNLLVNGTMTLTNTTSTTWAGAFGINATDVTISGTQTVTTVSSATVSDLFTISDATVLTSSSSSWTVDTFVATGACSGSAGIVVTGAGGWTGAGTVSNAVTMNTANQTLGNVSCNGQITFNANPDCTGATLTLTGGATLSNAMLSGSDITLNNVTITAAGTVLFTAPVGSDSFVIAGTLTMPNAAVTFSGLGITIGTWTNTAIASSAKTYTLVNNKRYRVTTAFDLTGASAALTLTLTSDHASNKAKIILGSLNIQDCAWVNPIRIDSGEGAPVFSYKGSITDSLNWFTAIDQFLDPPRARPQLHIGM